MAARLTLKYGIEPPLMGSAGDDPPPADFQSTASAELAYSPTHDVIFRTLPSFILVQSLWNGKLPGIMPMGKIGFEPTMFTTRDLIYSQAQHRHRCRFPGNIYAYNT